jgi:hypothetical protein
MDGGLVVRVAVVSGLAALAFVLLRDGLAGDRAVVVGAGAVIGVLALGGIVALVRIVVAAERRSRDSRS